MPDAPVARVQLRKTGASARITLPNAISAALPEAAKFGLYVTADGFRLVYLGAVAIASRAKTAPLPFLANEAV